MTFKMDKTAVKITSLHDRTSDYQYWMSRTPEERIAAIEFLRQQFIRQDDVQPRLKEFLQFLADQHVEYLIVGGYAVGYYGYPRYTGDLDIWVKPTKENGTRLTIVLDRFGFGDLNLTAQDLTKENAVIQLGYPPLRIDIMTSLDGVGFNDCYAQRNVTRVDGVAVSIISLNDLKKNKKAISRPRDQDDLQNLE